MNILPGLLTFLAKYNADFLYYQVWPTTDADIRLKIAKQEEQATSIDVIEQARTEEFCSPQQQALARRVSGIARDGDNDVPAPIPALFPKSSTTAWGMIALQKALHGYMKAIAGTDHAFLLDDVCVTDDMCGSKAFEAINDYMAPKNDETKREVKADYDDHLSSLAPRSSLPKFLADLLRLGKTKQLYFQETPSKIVIMEDMISQMKLVDGPDKALGWTNEITTWRLELAADKLKKEFTDGAIVGHFEKKLRSIESNYERAKAHAKKTGNKMFQKVYQDGDGHRGYKALAARKYDKPCSWCLENLGKEFYGHSVDECNNKKKKPPDGVPPDKGGGRACHLCGAGRDGTAFHPASACPKAADFKAFVQQRAHLVDSIVEMNKERAAAAPAAAGADDQYFTSPSDSRLPARDASLLPLKRTMMNGERPAMTCDFMNFTAYDAVARPITQVDGGCVEEDDEISLGEGWLDVERFIREGYWGEVERKGQASSPIAGTDASLPSKKAKPMYWPIRRGQPHPSADCICHTQPIPKKTKSPVPSTPLTPMSPRPDTPPTPTGSLPSDAREWSMGFEERQAIIANRKINTRDWSMEYEERRARIAKKENERAEQEKRDVASVRRGYKDEADEIEWRRNIEAIAQEWMLDSAAKATLREMGETARAMNKRQLICSPAPAVIDSGASDTMTNNLALIANPVPTRVAVQQADGSRIAGTYLRGQLAARANNITLPKMDVIYNKNFSTTLLSTPQLNRMGMEVVLSPKFGSFMQPSSLQCPICIPHPDRIVFDQNAHGTSLLLKPETRIQPTDISKRGSATSARLAALKQDDVNVTREATTQTDKDTQVTSHTTKKLIKLWHARLGGVGFARLQELSKNYPSIFKIPSTATFDEICQCCQRSSMRKSNAAAEITRMPAPMQEIHFDIFTYDGEYTLFLIDRGSRACWAYDLAAKSEVPRALQQFIIDAATNNFPVGHFVYTIVSTKGKGIDADAMNAYLEHHKLPQRVQIFFADNAGEHESLDLEEFITKLNILHLSSIAGSQYQNALAEHAGGWRLGNAIRHDFDMSGLTKGFLRYCVSLNAQRHNILPHSALNGKNPFSILYPDRTPPFELFKPFGCAATILKDAKDLRKKTLPRGLSGIYLGTSLPLGQHGYLIWVPQLQRVVTATHAVFDETYFPARSHQQRVSDFFGTLPADHDAAAIQASLRDDAANTHVAPDTSGYASDTSEDSIPDLLCSDSEGEDDNEDADNETSYEQFTTSEHKRDEIKASEHKEMQPQLGPLESEYFDEYELNPKLPDSIYFHVPETIDEASRNIIEQTTAPSPSATRSGKTYATANSAKSRYKPGFDVREGKEIDIKGYLSIGNEDLHAGGVISNAFLARVMVKALKAYAKENPDKRKGAAKEIALLRNPKTVKEALESPQRKEWIEAIRKEMQSLVDKQVFEIKKVPAGRKVIPLRIILKIKLSSDGSIDKYKARCVVAGFRQTAGLDYDPQGTYSPMTEPTTLRLALSIANELDLELDHLDIKTAYLNAVLTEKERFYCSPPPGFKVPPGYGLYIGKGLYGAHQSGAAWASTFRLWMKENAPEFVEAGNERCMYIMRKRADGTRVDLELKRGFKLEDGERLVIVIMNTDDMLIAYTKNAKDFVDDFEQTLNKSFEATPREEAEYYMGMHIVRDREKGLLGFDARRHVYNYIWHMGRDPESTAGVSTPLDPHETYTKDDCPQEVNTKLREKIWAAHGILIHLSIWARPDLAHAVSVLGRYVHNPSEKHWLAYDRIARYLTKTKDMRIIFGSSDSRHGQRKMYGYSDSDWGGSLDDRRSTSAYVFFLGGAAISWKVKLSPTVCLSTQEAEYVGLSEATKEALNLKMLLEQIGFGSEDPTTIYSDNQGAITMGLHPSNKPATRHIDMRRHFLRQHVELKSIVTPYVRTDAMVADCMTKQTPRPTHAHHFGMIFGRQDTSLPLKPIVKLVE